MLELVVPQNFLLVKSDPLEYHGLPFPALLAMPLQVLLQQRCELLWLGAFPGLKLVFSSLILFSVELYRQVCKKCDWADCYGWKEWEMLVKLWVKPLWKWLYCMFVVEKETLYCWKANWKNEINLAIGKAGRNGKGVWECSLKAEFSGWSSRIEVESDTF